MMIIAKSVLFGIATITAYLVVVVITTPALPATVAISAAFELNSIVIVGMGVGIGLQVYLSERAKLFGCRLNARRKTVSGNSGGTAAASFFSFFSLVPLGCCGWWLYVLSLLPSVLGTGASAVLIEHGQSLAYLGLAVVFGFAGLSAYKFRRMMHTSRLENLR